MGPANPIDVRLEAITPKGEKIAILVKTTEISFEANNHVYAHTRHDTHEKALRAALRTKKLFEEGGQVLSREHNIWIPATSGDDEGVEERSNNATSHNINYNSN